MGSEMCIRDRYSARALKNRASREAVKELAGQGEKFLKEMLPEPLRKKLDLTVDFGGMGVEEVLEGGRPTVGARYKTRDPFGYGGTFRVEARASQGERGASLRYSAPTDKITEALIGKPFAKKAKGGKVKKYSKGGGIRKPKLK